MYLLGFAEFRGKEQKTSSKGNSYFQLVFEDIDSGEQFKCYSKMDSVYSIPRDDLKKADFYTVIFNRYYAFGEFKFELVDVRAFDEGLKKKIK